MQIADRYENVAIISGPEPHRSILEKLLLRLFAKSGEKSIIIQGQPSDNQQVVKAFDNVDMVSHVEDDMLVKMLKGAKNIYCRSGYSTLMDMYALNIKNLILIPTPGQTEQEYLAEYFHGKGYKIIFQSDLAKLC